TLATYSAEQLRPAASRRQITPPRQEIRTRDGTVSLFMPASDTETSTGVKVVTLPGPSAAGADAGAGAGAVAGVINVFSPAGELRGLLNAAQITAFRTALASMVPFRAVYECPARARVVIFGAGKQAEWHARLVLLFAAERVERITVVHRTRRSLEQRGMAAVLRELGARYAGSGGGTAFATLCGEDADYDARLRAALADCDAIFGCTPATQPLFPSSYLLDPSSGGSRSGTRRRFISLIGSYRPHMREIDTATLRSANPILVDSREACLAESGELIAAQARPDELVEIGALLDEEERERVRGRLDEGTGNVIFKCVGIGIMDLVMGRELLALAARRGLGVDIEGF
ncbi:hypothetical protein KEM52_001407, partial [Ascosphaera acerosa]